VITKLARFELTYIQHRFSRVIRELFKFWGLPGIGHVQLCKSQSTGMVEFLRTIPQPIYCEHNWNAYYAVFILLCRQIGTSCLICVYGAKPFASNTIASIGLVMGYGFGKSKY
jgi:hypothetical protein